MIFTINVCTTYTLVVAHKDPIARKLRLRRRRDKDESDKVLKGMRDVAKDKAEGSVHTDEDQQQPVK